MQIQAHHDACADGMQADRGSVGRARTLCVPCRLQPLLGWGPLEARAGHIEPGVAAGLAPAARQQAAPSNRRLMASAARKEEDQRRTAQYVSLNEKQLLLVTELPYNRPPK